MKICIFGAASSKISNLYIEKTEALAYEMGQRGHTLVFGAGGEGLMGASARGVAKAGGKIYGVVPQFFIDDKLEGLYDNCTEMIVTDTMRERKRVMEEMADAFIIAPGGIGTFEELFEIITLKQLGRHGKPIAFFNINGYYDNMMDMMTHATEEGFIREKCALLYKCFENSTELLDFIETDKGVKWTPEYFKKD